MIESLDWRYSTLFVILCPLKLKQSLVCNTNLTRVVGNSRYYVHVKTSITTDSALPCIASKHLHSCASSQYH